MNTAGIEAAVVRRCNQLELAILDGKSLPSQDGAWRVGDLMILITVAVKLMRQIKGDNDECGVEQFLSEVGQ